MNILQPSTWVRPRGYANGIAARGTVISVAGQIGWNAQGAFETDDLSAGEHGIATRCSARRSEAGPHPLCADLVLVGRDEYVTRAAVARLSQAMTTSGATTIPR